MAKTGTAEASPVDNQWLCRTVRRAECGCDYKTFSGTEWLGNIAEVEQYRSLLEWAVRCRDAGEMLALPLEFHWCRISPFVYEDVDRSRGAAR
jgi:hypothetical protein